jgi:hypothetical protein
MQLVPEVDPSRLRFTDVAGELLRGAFCVAGGHDSSGAAVIEYRPRVLAKRSAEAPLQTLRAVLYLMETLSAASVEACRNGVTLLVYIVFAAFVYLFNANPSLPSDLAGVSLTSADHSLHELLLNTLQNRYPMRVASVFIVRAHWSTVGVRCN